ncbi:hypothetical protein BTVI_123028 [Pitangus sulphuratus]|nr:hypothetical protein BTVI_123028 [Pitangus sulphuratus]
MRTGAWIDDHVKLLDSDEVSRWIETVLSTVLLVTRASQIADNYGENRYLLPLEIPSRTHSLARWVVDLAYWPE